MDLDLVLFVVGSSFSIESKTSKQFLMTEEDAFSFQDINPIYFLFPEDLKTTLFPKHIQSLDYWEDTSLASSL